MTDDLKELSGRKLNFFQTLKAVAWGFLGVRKGTGYAQDIQKLNPVYIIIAGVIAGAALVLLLLLIITWVVPALT